MQFQFASASLVTLLLASTRILAWSVVAPPLATGGVPKVIKTVLSVALGLAVVPVAQPHAPAAQFVPVAESLLEQVLIGAALGFVTRLVFSAVEAAGSLLDLFGGFSLSAAYDPLMTTMTSIYGRFYALLATTLIFATNAHLLIFQGFLRTFSSIPLDGHFSLARLDRVISSGVTDLFVAALQIAGPLIVVLFIADIALGVLNRIAPQLNAFSMSFPIKIGLTLLLVGMGFTLMPGVITQLAEHANRLIGAVTG
ncbi:MAG: flagellar biosynthesis protein FliR [Pseudonocardiales bacterium]|nr:flagellar biosynthesis protein FliR [Pseudonocardiales bacterium]